MALKYVGLPTTHLYSADTGSSKVLDLLWGDQVETMPGGNQRTKVRARGKIGFVSSNSLEGSSLLEVYFIDVGQGDGVLIRTPDDRHVLIDGGYRRDQLPTGKNAADFVDWKFAKDYQRDRIDLDAMIASHCDADHYGGLWDLIDPGESHELDINDVRVEAFYHAGLSWWGEPGHSKWLGPYQSTTHGNSFTRLLRGRTHARESVRTSANPRLQGWWRRFVEQVTKTRKRDGSFSTIKRLSHVDQYLPEFGPDSSEATLRVLGPVELRQDGTSMIRRYTGGNSVNTNGNSILLRLDYGRVRILLTGDLNAKSQDSLLVDHQGSLQEFECDVGKACHHGSEDVSYRFLQTMRPAVTVISSGDNEGHNHPRPNLIAASATTGHLDMADGELRSPLIYSTELARSISLGRPTRLDVPGEDGAVATVVGSRLAGTTVTYEETKAGDLHARTRAKTMGQTSIVAGIVYGLVNVRTDGTKLLCATMNEKDYSWDVKEIESRF